MLVPICPGLHPDIYRQPRSWYHRGRGKPLARAFVICRHLSLRCASRRAQSGGTTLSDPIGSSPTNVEVAASSLSSVPSLAPAPQSPQDQLFKATFHHAAIGIAIVDLTGRVLEVNRALEEMLGYDEGELIGKRSAEFSYA